MKSGTVHTMLRVTYEGAGTEGGGEFVIFVMDFVPDTGRTIYKPDQITDSGQLDRGTVRLRYGDIYVGISNASAPLGDVFAAFRAIRPGR